MARARSPIVLSPRGEPSFPDPETADARGLLAVGGSLAPRWLLTAYERGIFPWYDEGLPPLWWCPNPRAVMDPEHLHVSRSMERVLKKGSFDFTFNAAFDDVMQACGDERGEGTWILPEMREAYGALHRLGHAHSFEAWQGTTLAGGLYGVQRGALFAAESMFHRATNASKFVLVRSLRFLFDAGVRLFDVQFLTPHLESLGAYAVPRREYLRRLAAATPLLVDLSRRRGSGEPSGR